MIIKILDDSEILIRCLKIQEPDYVSEKEFSDGLEETLNEFYEVEEISCE